MQMLVFKLGKAVCDATKIEIHYSTVHYIKGDKQCYKKRLPYSISVSSIKYDQVT